MRVYTTQLRGYTTQFNATDKPPPMVQRGKMVAPGSANIPWQEYSINKTQLMRWEVEYTDFRSHGPKQFYTCYVGFDIVQCLGVAHA